jgi:hypothetical protein
MKSRAKMVVVEATSEGATSMGKSIIDLSSVTTVGLDLAKHVFQVHGVDASGRVVVAKAISPKAALLAGGESAVIAAMSQADAENSRLSPKRPLGSFHLLRNLR